jgi:hypothetical protein
MSNRAFIAAALLLMAPGAIRAQENPQPAAECAAGAGAAYRRCALWMDGRRVRRGAEGAIIAERGFFSPLRLTRVVEGDSAQLYARAFERDTRRAGAYGLLSAVLMVGGVLVLDAYDCDRDPTLGVCTNADDNYNLGAAALFLGGVVVGGVSGWYEQRAGRNASRAVFWHNANFAR